jgi:hypothetical protein
MVKVKVKKKVKGAFKNRIKKTGPALPVYPR